MVSSALHVMCMYVGEAAILYFLDTTLLARSSKTRTFTNVKNEEFDSLKPGKQLVQMRTYSWLVQSTQWPLPCLTVQRKKNGYQQKK
ncbi:hypothetical protein GDO78_004435 [Eleutherodactylus coqui]|uniref:Uncharacterized protein n=1 Tax=Eleutherodactylus coqui TaxID=57060 RepID=A0A8J6K0C8_ELECQ|nr:hypothetical protein GDO78_004435 [Eleutherodactylus coqui]